MFLSFLSRFNNKGSLFTFFLIIIFILFSIILDKSYYNHFATFGCFDECFNYIGGYFLIKGRILYKEIFFNHQLLMPYISAVLQKSFHPSSIYYLVLEHRMFIFIFGICMDIFIIWRFRLVGIGFAFLFEATKYYFMGSLFLPESILVYPLVYLFGLAWYKVNNNRLSSFDYIISALFAWAVIFLREPVVIVTLFLYIIINFDKCVRKEKIRAIGLFFILIISTLLLTSIPDYIYQVITINFRGVFSTEITSHGNNFITIFKIFFYPIFILIWGKKSLLRNILVGIDIIFVFSFVIFFLKTNKKWMGIILLFNLGLSNLRLVIPGTMYYETFHMLPWYGLFIMGTFFLLKELKKIPKMENFVLPLKVFAGSIFLYAVLSNQSFLHDNTNRDLDFRLSFDRYYIYGQAVKYLAKPEDTLFLEKWDDLIYLQADLIPGYSYGFFGAAAGGIDRFEREREKMFKNNPPDFYYSPNVKGQFPFGFLPNYRKNMYEELIYVSSPSGLFIKDSKIKEITPEQWEKIKTLKFYPKFLYNKKQ